MKKQVNNRLIIAAVILLIVTVCIYIYYDIQGTLDRGSGSGTSQNR